MAGNPSDITNMLNEALNATNKIAASQLEAAKNVNEIQDKNSEKAKKLTKVIRSTVEQLELFQRNVEEKQENKKKKDNLISSFLKSTTDIIEKTKPKTVKEVIKPKPQTDKNIEKILISNSILNVRGNLIVNSKNFKVPVDIGSKTQSTEDYYRTDDVSSDETEELKLLRSIESKLSFSENSGSGLFGSIFGGLGGLSKMFAGAATAGIGGVAGSLFGLSKFKKLGNLFKPLQKLKPSGLLKDSAKLLKNPKILVPALIAGAGYVIYDSIKSGVFSQPLDKIGEAEQREKGGPVVSGKPYIVGEKGPELFTPRETGRIIPNHKLQSHTEKYSNPNKIYDKMFGLIEENNKKTSSVFDRYTDNFEKVIDFFRPSNILELIKSGIKKVIGSIGSFGGKVADVIVNASTSIANMVTGGTNAPSPTPSLSMSSLVPVSIPKETPGPARRIGDKNVPKDMKVSLHKNEMVIPAAQSEALRATAKLQNQPLTTKQTPAYSQKNQLGKEFWMNEFVPQFANMIKTNKVKETPFVSYEIGNIFGVA